MTRKIQCIVAATFVTACLVAGTGTAHAQSAKSNARSKPRPDVVKTLDAINIEGEIDVPQVLFITARDFRRYRDGLGVKFRMNALEVAGSADLPTRLRIVAKNKEEGQ